ncbi:MAG: hypothetical protein ACRELC_09690, partial [Gemmatimonadota bacterium]
GLAGVKWYAWDVAIGGIGEPDRSMLFWGLSILWLALCALALGAWLAWVGWPRRRASGSPEPPSAGHPGDARQPGGDANRSARKEG